MFMEYRFIYVIDFFSKSQLKYVHADMYCICIYTNKDMFKLNTINYLLRPVWLNVLGNYGTLFAEDCPNKTLRELRYNVCSGLSG